MDLQEVQQRGLLSTGAAALHYGVCEKTIRTWIGQGKLATTVTVGGHRRIDTSKPLVSSVLVKQPVDSSNCVVTYARVSSRKQLPHRDHQQDELRREARRLYPNIKYRDFADVGSGLNFKRPGLRSLLEFCMCRRVQAVVVAYRDRLCRFGFDLIEWLLGKYNTKLVVLHQATQNTHESLSEDLLAVVTVFSARAHGMRKYKRTLEKELGRGTEDPGKEEEEEGGDRSSEWKQQKKTDTREEGGREKTETTSESGGPIDTQGRTGQEETTTTSFPETTGGESRTLQDDKTTGNLAEARNNNVGESN